MLKKELYVLHLSGSITDTLHLFYSEGPEEANEQAKDLRQEHRTISLAGAVSSDLLPDLPQRRMRCGVWLYFDMLPNFFIDRLTQTE